MPTQVRLHCTFVQVGPQNIQNVMEVILNIRPGTIAGDPQQQLIAGIVGGYIVYFQCQLHSITHTELFKNGRYMRLNSALRNLKCLRDFPIACPVGHLLSHH